jgi:pentatricopeptide repeat domain-containing protein 1
MRFHNCRPDTITYSALISAYERGGQWLRAVKAFEAMQSQGCRPDSSIYQSMVDMLWQSGVAWLQARALQLYTSAARSWQFRFTVQQASPADASLVEFIVPASTASVAVLSTQRWLFELRTQLDRDGTLLFGGGAGAAQCERVAVSLGRGRHTREQGCGNIRRALFTMLDGLGSPFRCGRLGQLG